MGSTHLTPSLEGPRLQQPGLIWNRICLSVVECGLLRYKMLKAWKRILKSELSLYLEKDDPVDLRKCLDESRKKHDTLKEIVANKESMILISLGAISPDQYINIRDPSDVYALGRAQTWMKEKSDAGPSYSDLKQLLFDVNLSIEDSDLNTVKFLARKILGLNSLRVKTLYTLGARDIGLANQEAHEKFHYPRTQEKRQEQQIRRVAQHISWSTLKLEMIDYGLLRQSILESEIEVLALKIRETNGENVKEQLRAATRKHHAFRIQRNTKKIKVLTWMKKLKGNFILLKDIDDVIGFKRIQCWEGKRRFFALSWGDNTNQCTLIRNYASKQWNITTIEENILYYLIGKDIGLANRQDRLRMGW